MNTAHTTWTPNYKLLNPHLEKIHVLNILGFPLASQNVKMS